MLTAPLALKHRPQLCLFGIWLSPWYLVLMIFLWKEILWEKWTVTNLRTVKKGERTVRRTQESYKITLRKHLAKDWFYCWIADLWAFSYLKPGIPLSPCCVSLKSDCTAGQNRRTVALNSKVSMMKPCSQAPWSLRFLYSLALTLTSTKSCFIEAFVTNTQDTVSQDFGRL